MNVTLEVERIVINDKKYIRIEKIEAPTKEELPFMYFREKGDSVFAYDHSTLVFDSPVRLASGEIGSCVVKLLSHYPEEEFYAITAKIKSAMKRANQIIAELKAENENWHGKATFVI